MTQTFFFGIFSFVNMCNWVKFISMSFHCQTNTIFPFEVSQRLGTRIGLLNCQLVSFTDFTTLDNLHNKIMLMYRCPYETKLCFTWKKYYCPEVSAGLS